MSSFIEDVKKGLKKVADFLEITPVEAPHHSLPYESPPKEWKRDLTQIATNQPTTTQEEIDRTTNIKDYNELLYLAKVQSPTMIREKKRYISGVGYV